MIEELIINEIENNKEEYIEFLREMIKTDSYNPPGNEKNVALKVEKYLKDFNIKCDLYPFDNNRANLIAYLNNNFDGKNLLLNGHMDVVLPGSKDEWSQPPLSAYIKRKKIIYGRGATDMKSGLAAMVIALKILKKLKIKTSGNLILNAVADEETTGNLGTKWCLDNHLKSIKCDFAIIGEPTGYNRHLPKTIVIGEKGRLVLKIITNGIACHSSLPFIGKNAIYMMSEIIQNLNKLIEYIPEIKPPLSLEELKKLMSVSFPSYERFEEIYNQQSKVQILLIGLTKFSTSLNIIKAGTNTNVVPDVCEAIIDIRLLPGQNGDLIFKGFKKMISDLGYLVKDELQSNSEDVFVYIEKMHLTEPSIWNDWGENTSLKSFYTIVEQIYDKKPFISMYPGSADACFYRNSNYCHSTILFGPGEGETAHAADECVVIQDFINSIKVYTLFAYNFLK